MPLHLYTSVPSIPPSLQPLLHFERHVFASVSLRHLAKVCSDGGGYVEKVGTVVIRDHQKNYQILKVLKRLTHPPIFTGK